MLKNTKKYKKFVLLYIIIQYFSIFVKNMLFSHETWQKVAKISFFFFLISLFFPLRLVLLTNSAYKTGAYSDFTSFSLYLSDILLFITWCALFLPRGEGVIDFYHVVKRPIILFFWLILAILWKFDSSISLNYYFLLKYAELIVAYGTTVLIFKNGFKHTYLYWLFALLGASQSILALLQFWLQTSLGLKYLGETLISSSLLGIAKIVSDGTTYIRGYGTFPHPNLLSAFLVTALLFSSYLAATEIQKIKRFWAMLIIIINLFGLVITFSRAGYLGGLLGLTLLFGYLLHYKAYSVWQTLTTTLMTGLCAILFFWPLLTTRATITDQSTLDRMKYNQAGLRMIKTHPIFGIGIGESALHMEQFMNETLKPWEKQPVHSYFILAGAEIGLPGLAILLWFFSLHILNLFKNLRLTNKPEFGLWLSVLLSFIVLMQFDHYFFTLEQTQLLLWITLAASMALTTANLKQTQAQ